MLIAQRAAAPRYGRQIVDDEHQVPHPAVVHGSGQLLSTPGRRGRRYQHSGSADCLQNAGEDLQNRSGPTTPDDHRGGETPVVVEAAHQGTRHARHPYASLADRHGLQTGTHRTVQSPKLADTAHEQGRVVLGAQQWSTRQQHNT